ncbi:MAG: hypothetical protein [Bacteriophage sp.]|nr:MAG: hypothetical protein [Bacteriophage sp.]
MARQQSVAEINAFVKGIITEASPLTFPENASIDENNLVPQKDGSRKRRLGINFESSFSNISTSIPVSDDVSYSSYSWKGPGGYTQTEFAVVQVGGSLSFFDSATLPLSGNQVFSTTINSDNSSLISMTSVDGVLIVVDGSGQVYTFDYDGSSITQKSGRLLIRDLFGVEDIVSGVSLLSGNNITIRPIEQTSPHIYNLRNQTFSRSKKWQSGGPNSDADPIFMMKSLTGTFPSNSDNLVVFLFADANNSDDRNIKRYFVSDNIRNPLGTNRAPVGYFIIDALDRGASRIAQAALLYAQDPLLQYPIVGLPTDRTPGGASVVSTFAGRVFYGGFSSQLIGGDSQSPRMTSYVLFSRLVQSSSDVFKCYQEGDPTSSETPDLVDTDGGFLRVDGAYNIKQLVNVGDSLMVVAENGVWKVTGGSGYGFKATDYVVTKVTEHGTVSPGSVVLLDNTLMYWSDDGIYHVAQNQYGDWAATNLTNTTIQSLFDDIPYQAKKRCFGAYDSYTRKVRWLYNNYYSSKEDCKELVLDVGLGSFYPATIPRISNALPLPLCLIRIPPFQTSTGFQQIVDSLGNNIVDSSSNNVVALSELIDSSLSELYYVVLSGTSGGNINYTFASYRDQTFTDWVSYNGIGVDATAYLLTGWTGMGDFQRQKQVAYLTVYSVKTETGFDSDYFPINSSSILVQSQWNWTNLESSGKWGPEFQAYRHKRLWIPSGNSSGFDDGDYVITTKNKLRGRGKVLSLLFKTEPKKDFHLLGWSYLGSISATV